MKHVFLSLADAIAPRLCPVCKCSLVRGERLMCMACLAALPRTRMHVRPDNGIVARLARPGLRLELAAAWMDYNRHSPYASLIRDAKYRSMPALVREAGRCFALEMQSDAVAALSDIDVLLPVPVHWTKLLRRGYNQSREAAVGIASVLGVPVGDNLRALRPHRTQTRRGASERLHAMKGLFALRASDELRGLHVAVVDDVVTTGATMAEALRVLSEAGLRAISVLALAAVRSDEWHFAE